MANLATIVKERSEHLAPESIPVVREYSDVLPAKLLGLSEDRKIEFIIDLVLGTAPVLKAPYQMLPAELKDLKAQLIARFARQGLNKA